MSSARSCDHYIYNPTMEVTTCYNNTKTYNQCYEAYNAFDYYCKKDCNN